MYSIVTCKWYWNTSKSKYLFDWKIYIFLEFSNSIEIALTEEDYFPFIVKIQSVDKSGISGSSWATSTSPNIEHSMTYVII